MMSLPPQQSSNALNYTTSVIKKYWCHLCKKEFQKIFIENMDIQCAFCGHTFCEELETEDQTQNSHPIHFQPYESTQNRSSTISRMFLSRGLRPRTTSGLLDLIIEYLAAENYEDDFEQIINQIMQNDPNKYGNPPASKKSVEALEKYTIDENKLKSFGEENTCSVCKDEFEIGSTCLSMPCKHNFHEDCLLPWLKERNSCPVCRYELPTDDEDFENRKRAARANNSSNPNH